MIKDKIITTSITSGFNKDIPVSVPASMRRLKKAQKFTTICPYCAVGCGQIISVLNGKVINVEGDIEHPINQGSLCTKGNALYQIANNDRRLDRVLYRAPGSKQWEGKSWDWALEQIAGKIKKTRDENWVETDFVLNDGVHPFKTETDGFTVNRTEAIACLGGAALDNEECYLYTKLARSLGIVYLEHQARI